MSGAKRQGPVCGYPSDYGSGAREPESEPMRMTEPLLLVHLTPEDYKRFHEARVPYSGSTGPYARPEDYHGLAPYVATFFGELARSVVAMRWHHFTVSKRGGQWIVRHKENHADQA
jgi:hypothetical protein